MELFRFLAWQWKRFNFEEVSLMLAALATIASIALSVYAGASFGWLLFSAICTLAAFITAASLVFHTREQWRKYKKVKEQEAQAIVDKLRGRSY